MTYTERSDRGKLFSGKSTSVCADRICLIISCFRDPWWVFTTCRLVFIIKRDYFKSLKELIRTSPRFSVLIFCMCLSICFLIVDVIVTAAGVSGNTGINPYWRVRCHCLVLVSVTDKFPKLALVFKSASDTIFLDDFKMVLDSITAKAFGRAGGLVHRGTDNGQRSRPGIDISTHKADRLDSLTALTIHSEHRPRDTRTKWGPKHFDRHDNDNNSSEEMQIQRDTTMTITLSNLNPPRNRNGSFGSVDRILPKPETAANKYPHSPWDSDFPVDDDSKDFKR